MKRRRGRGAFCGTMAVASPSAGGAAALPPADPGLAESPVKRGRGRAVAGDGATTRPAAGGAASMECRVIVTAYALQVTTLSRLYINWKDSQREIEVPQFYNPLSRG